MSETEKLFGAGASAAEPDDLPEIEAKAQTPTPGTDAAPEPQGHPADAPAPVGVYGDQATPKSDDPPVSEGRLNALLAEREKRQEAERRAAEIERKMAEMQRQQPQEQPRAPDMFADPEAFAAYQARQQDARLWQVKVEMSQVMARQAHGSETVDAAVAWWAERERSNPALAAQIMREPHPVEHAVREYRRHQLLEAAGDVSDPVAAIRALAAKHGLTIAEAAPAAPAAPPSPTQPQKQPPRSLAAAPSAGGPVRGQERPPEALRLFGK